MEQNLEGRTVEVVLTGSVAEEKGATLVVNTTLEKKDRVHAILNRIKEGRPQIQIFGYKIREIREGNELLYINDPLAKNNKIN
ncbi:hypothetical protein EOM39_02365 [Candidatus Gracilibacteria bacterium]|nr:hypothetical protein [Candidatus Gracilibacteria bacterium]